MKKSLILLSVLFLLCNIFAQSKLPGVEVYHSSVTTGIYLGDLEDEKITLLGRDYNIVKARRVAATGGGVELTLMGGAVKDTLNEGETKTYTINGKEYEVTVNSITDTGTIYAKFTINGETTKSLKDGDSTTLSDGTQIGVADVVPNEAGDVTQDQVEFYLGSDKIYLKDSTINGSNTAWSNTLEVGSEKIDDAYVIITGSDDHSTFSIDTIQLNITADDDYWVAAGHKLTEYMEEPQALLTSWDMRYDGLDPSIATETYKIKSSGSNQYKLEFTDGDGNQASVPLTYTSGGSALAMGDDSNALVLNESLWISKNDFLIVTDGAQDAGNRKTYALKYKGASRVASGETALVKFDNLGTGKRIEQIFTEQAGTTADATLKLGGATFSVINVSADTANDFRVQVDLNGGTNFADTANVDITTNAGLQITVDNGTSNAYMIVWGQITY